jgi:hypothetical protein
MGLVLPFAPRLVFDDTATRIMGEAFDAACEEIGDMGRLPLVREDMAKRIIDSARAGERDVNRLREAALKGQEAEPKLRPRQIDVARTTPEIGGMTGIDTNGILVPPQANVGDCAIDV